MTSLALAVTACPVPVSGQTAVEAWVQSYHMWGTFDNVPLAMAVAGNGNVVVTGTSADEFGNTSWLTVACSGSTGDLLWTQSYHGPIEFTSDQPNALAVDAAGNAYVTGVVFVAGSQDYLTIKYSRDGLPVWVRNYNGTADGTDGATDIALDQDGNIIVTGLSEGTSGLGNYFDYVTVKYSASGDPLWVNRYNGPGNKEDSPTDLAIDAVGNIFVTGATETNDGDSDYLTIAISGDGEPLWARQYNGPGNSTDFAKAVAVDGDGNVFVTGFSGSGGNTSIAEYATVAYSPAGDVRWTSRYHANELQHGFHNLAADVAVDSAGNVFVTGGAGGFQSPSGGFATLKYSNAGEPLWTRTYNGPVTAFGYNDDARAVAIDRNGNVIVTGRSYAENSDFDAADLATVAYSNTGAPLWTHRYNGPANGDDTPMTKRSLALGPDGSVYLACASDGDPSEERLYQFVIVKYAPPPSAPPLEVAKADGSVLLSWPSDAGNFDLEESTDLGQLDPWSPVEWEIVNDGPRFLVTVPVDAPRMFFRLVSR